MKLPRAVLLLALTVAAACRADAEGPSGRAAREVGRVRIKRLNEASGLVASRAHPGTYWTHNDGDDGVLYAIAADGSPVGQVKVDAKFKDLEDIAADAEGNLFLADVGNNDRDRKHVTVYRVREPDPRADAKIRPTASWKLTFPDKPFNCESLVVAGDRGYVISKVESGQRAGVYRFSLAATRKAQTLVRLYDLPITEPVTAADLSPDGRSLAVLTRGALYVLPVSDDLAVPADATPRTYALPALQTEGCAFNADGALMIAESGEILQVALEDRPSSTTTTAAPATTQPSR
jgi:hypothetical protein